MKKLLPALVLALALQSLAFAQDADTIPAQQEHRGQRYFSSGGEAIFSFASVELLGGEDGSLLRFSPLFNFQSYYNYDPNPYFGVFTGLALRNVGFIYEFPGTDIRKKYRNYQIGVPVGIKLGKMSGSFLFGGYELEFPFHYKEKTFEDGKRTDKFSVWFSDRTPRLYHSVFAGIQLPYSVSLKLKFYLSEFFNRGFLAVENGVPTFPYAGLRAHVFYLSVSFNMYQNGQFTFDKDF